MLHPILLAPLSIPDGTDWTGLILRYAHIAAGVVWIGMLYFFNLVNVNFQKEMTASLDPKSNHTQFTKLMPVALWWFRWGAMITVLTGFAYYMILMSANSGTPNAATGSVGMTMGIWMGGFIIAWLLNWASIQMFADKKSNPEAKAPDRGGWVAIVHVLVLAGMACLFHCLIGPNSDGHVLFIAIGGGMGMIMFMNVWMTIWPKMKKVIAARELFLKDGTPVPPEIPKLARRAFLASRANTWMSIFMLAFMVLAGHGASLWSKAEPAKAEAQKAEPERVMPEADAMAPAPAAATPEVGGPIGGGVASAPEGVKSAPK